MPFYNRAEIVGVVPTGAGAVVQPLTIAGGYHRAQNGLSGSGIEVVLVTGTLGHQYAIKTASADAAAWYLLNGDGTVIAFIPAGSTVPLNGVIAIGAIGAQQYQGAAAGSAFITYDLIDLPWV
jgi:hypothetical protein